MIFDIYEQSDLFRIANCGRRSTLERWLNDKMIPFSHDSQGKVIAHKKAVESCLGVEAEPSNDEPEALMWLGDEDKYSYIDNVGTYCQMIKSFSQICLNLVYTDSEHIDNSIQIKKQAIPAELKGFIDYCHNENKDTVIEKGLFS